MLLLLHLWGMVAKKYYFQIIDLRFKYGNKSLDSLSPNFNFLVPLSICLYCCLSSTYRAPAVIHHVVSEPSNGPVDGAHPSAGDSWCITSVVCKDIRKETRNFVVSLCKGQMSVHITSIRSSGFWNKYEELSSRLFSLNGMCGLNLFRNELQPSIFVFEVHEHIST